MREYGCTSLVTSLVREISRIDHRELARSDYFHHFVPASIANRPFHHFTRDTSGTRSYSLFLVDLAERCLLQLLAIFQ